jgi:pyruvate formate lyase activating enzyme
MSLPDNMRDVTGLIFNIQHYALHDGPGIRTTVFLKGCPLRCWWCHNPESQEYQLETRTANPPQPFPESGRSHERVFNGDYTWGRTVTLAEVLAEIGKDVIFFDESDGGVTFSGGEPLMQPEFLGALLCVCRQQGIHTALDTCGYAPASVIEAILPHTDLILYDLKLMDDSAHQHYTGVANVGILANLRLLAARHKPVYLRVPIIPGITDTPANLQAMVAFLDAIRSCIRQVNLLPYHHIAAGKYEKLGRAQPLRELQPPTAARLHEIQTLFEEHGFHVKIGG